MNRSRTENSLKNSFYAFFSKMITVIIQFLIRTVFIRVLSAEYLGVNGLFTNILTILSLADLGIGIAIPYTLYKPLANNDKRKINVLMKFYSKVYIFIGLIVLVVGLLLTPFLDFFINEPTSISNLQIIYILFVINSAVSYFFTYKKILIDSDQKGFIANKIIMQTTIIFGIVQIIFLCFTKNYIFYLILNILLTLFQNILVSHKCDQLYPYILDTVQDKMAKEDVTDIKKNISALCIYRIGGVVMSGIDNIIISKMIGIVAVGIYSNYLLIINSINSLVSQLINAITSSIGNLVNTENSNKSEEILFRLLFLNYCIYSLLGISIALFINPFIKLWIGNNYLLNYYTAIIIAVDFYVIGMQNVITSYRNAFGVFQQGKYRPVIMVAVNIVLSIILAKFIGVFGVILATVISRIFIVGIFDPIVVYKYGFKSSPKKYFKTYWKYLFVFLMIMLTMAYFIQQIVINSLFSLFLIGIVVLILLVSMYWLIIHKSEQYHFFKGVFLEYILKKGERKL